MHWTPSGDLVLDLGSLIVGVIIGGCLGDLWGTWRTARHIVKRLEEDTR